MLKLVFTKLKGLIANATAVNTFKNNEKQSLDETKKYEHASVQENYRVQSPMLNKRQLMFTVIFVLMYAFHKTI